MVCWTSSRSASPQPPCTPFAPRVISAGSARCRRFVPASGVLPAAVRFWQAACRSASSVAVCAGIRAGGT